ncbi:MAG: hypothetical protein NC131_09930 [Roseburia sp.]|nr:hypothetical protein [Roseburia sp.]
MDLADLNFALSAYRNMELHWVNSDLGPILIMIRGDVPGKDNFFKRISNHDEFLNERINEIIQSDQSPFIAMGLDIGDALSSMERMIKHQLDMKQFDKSIRLHHQWVESILLNPKRVPRYPHL